LLLLNSNNKHPCRGIFSLELNLKKKVGVITALAVWAPLSLDMADTGFSNLKCKVCGDDALPGRLTCPDHTERVSVSQCKPATITSGNLKPSLSPSPEGKKPPARTSSLIDPSLRHRESLHPSNPFYGGWSECWFDDLGHNVPLRPAPNPSMKNSIPPPLPPRRYGSIPESD
jgi:hypothetical protein